MKNLDYIELGATLFVPASHKSLKEITSGEKYPYLRTLVIDNEDGLDEKDLDFSKQNILEALSSFGESSPHIFLRPRNREDLKRLLALDGIDKVHGFVLPKFSLSNANEYFEILKDSEHLLMPSIEGSELFNMQELHSLKEILLTNKEKIVLVRFGLEDMLRQLKMRRKCSDSIFDFAVTNTVVGNFIGIFKSAGFAISGGVYPCYEDDEGFLKDVKRDLKEGLFSKTVIHPNQISLCDALYAVEKYELDEALEIIESEKAVFTQNGKMAEHATMEAYSYELIARAKIYGIR